MDESKPSKPRCVIKQFLPPNISTLAASELFREEAERLKSLGSHPQIPTFIDYLENQEQRYIIQEFIDGSNLEQELVEAGAFDEDRIRQLLNDILPVLKFVHDHCVIHRDIKPENIIRRSRDRQLVLVDFGASKYASGTALIKIGTPVVRSFTIVFATLSVITGIGISFLDYQQRREYQRGLNIMMAGLLMSIAMNIFWNRFIAPPATTSIAPIQQTTKNQSPFSE